ncbi:MAG: hypothetical protein IT428_30360 [Planctomycetaceae bacterium]|nr:hypothetical protein [Planctomycetaceae bacterium]
MKTAVQRDRSTLPVAAIPLVFGVQQAFEGLVWVGIHRADAELTRLAATGFLFFALAFWLFWIPFCAVFLDPRRAVKRLLAVMALLGLIGGAVLFFPILSNPSGPQATVVRHSIRYEYASPPTARFAPETVWHSFYLAIVATPLIVVKNKTLLWFATALVASAVVSHLYFLYAFASIWCFLAALLSLYLAYLFHHGPQRRTP